MSGGGVLRIGGKIVGILTGFQIEVDGRPVDIPIKPPRIAGDIFDASGDLYFFDELAITSGLASVTFEQALQAIPFGWHWVDFESDGRVAIQRGDAMRLCSRRIQR